MTLRRRLIPVAALVVAIGASAAGAATAAQAGTATAKTGTAAAKTGQKPVDCKMALKADALKKGLENKGGVKPSLDECKKKVETVSLDTIASELGVSKTTLAQALTETKQWVVAAKTKPSVAQFEQHLADQLHVPVAKLVSVFGAV